MTSSWIQALLLGLSMGTTCILSCGPIYSTYLLQQEALCIRSATNMMLKILFGRFIAYSVFGLFVGVLGALFAIHNRPILIIVTNILCAAILIGVTITNRESKNRCPVPKYYKLIKSPFILGIATGINFCPAFLIATTKAFSVNGAMEGMLFFAFFFVGTSVYMLPLLAFGILSKNKVFRTIGRVSSLLVAFWLLYNAFNVFQTIH